MQNNMPYNFKYADIFLGCYFTDHLIEHYDEYLTNKLQGLVVEIDSLRKKQGNKAINPRFAVELKHTFNVLVSFCSAKIGGNNLSLEEYIKAKNNESGYKPTPLKEIENLEKAIHYINSKNLEKGIDKKFITSLHQIVTEGLDVNIISSDNKGDITPGMYRRKNPKLSAQFHLPPHWEDVENYMENLISFINDENNFQYDLIKAAITQYRFLWIRPFNSANEKLSRLLAYAITEKYNLQKGKKQLFNPAIVLCKNNYFFQNEANLNNDEGILSWLEYNFNEIKDEFEKINMLTDYSFLEKKLLNPAIDRCLSKNIITDKQALVLHKAVEKQVIHASDVKEIYPYKTDTEISREIKKLIDKKFLVKEFIGTRKYVLCLQDNCILIEFLSILKEHGFITN